MTVAALKTGETYDRGTSLVPKFAAIAASSSGANEVVAAVTGKKIRVLSYVEMANGAVNTKWQSASTDKTGLWRPWRASQRLAEHVAQVREAPAESRPAAAVGFVLRS
jgi:hypothetical protein